MPSPLRAAAVTAAFISLVASPAAFASKSADTAAVRKATVTYLDAVISENPAAICRTFSTRAQQQAIKAAVAFAEDTSITACPQAMKVLLPLMRQGEEELRKDRAEVRRGKVTRKGRRATIRVGSTSVDFVLERGRWLIASLD